MSLRSAFLTRLGVTSSDTAAQSYSSPTLRRRNSAAMLPSDIADEVTGAQVTHDTLSRLQRNPDLMRLSIARPDLHRTANPTTRVRIERLQSSLVSIKCSFDAIPYGLRVKPSDRGFGGVAMAFDFYATLFSAAKQLSTRDTGITAAEELRASNTMSVGELIFFLRDFNVLPQLISRVELMYILSKRSLGKEFRNRRQKHSMLSGMLKREEEELRREYHRRGIIPGSKLTKNEGTTKSYKEDVHMHSLLVRKERVEKLQSIVRQLDAASLDPCTRTEALMEHSHWEFSYTELLEVLVRIALFAFSKPAVEDSSIGAPKRDTSGRNTGLSHTSTGSTAAARVPGFTKNKPLTPSQKVLRLLHYMQLDDPAATKHRIQTVGAATQQYLNSESDRIDSSSRGYLGNTEGLVSESQKLTLELAAAADGKTMSNHAEEEITLDSTLTHNPGLRASKKLLENRTLIKSPRDKGLHHGGQFAVDADGNVIDTHYTMKSVAARRESTRQSTSSLTGKLDDNKEEEKDEDEHEITAEVSEETTETAASSPNPAASAPTKPAPFTILLPEDALVQQYSNSLLEIVRNYDYDHTSPVYRDFGGPFIDCGEIVHKHASLNPYHEDAAAFVTEQAYTYRITLTNECTDVLQVAVKQENLPPDIVKLRILECADHLRLANLPPKYPKDGVPVYPLRKSGKWDKVGLNTVVLSDGEVLAATDLASGLSLVVELSISPGEHAAEHLGRVLVACTSVTGVKEEHDVPVYVKIQPSTEKAVAPTMLTEGKGSEESDTRALSPKKPVAPIILRGMSFRELQTGMTSRPQASSNNAVRGASTRGGTYSSSLSTSNTRLSGSKSPGWDSTLGVATNHEHNTAIRQEYGALAESATRILEAELAAERKSRTALTSKWKTMVPQTLQKTIELRALEHTLAHQDLATTSASVTRKRPTIIVKSAVLPPTSPMMKGRDARVASIPTPSLDSFVKASFDTTMRPSSLAAAAQASLPRTTYLR